MPEQLLTILKICFLVLLYLFFLRVLRAVWTELRTDDLELATEPAAVPAAAVPAPVPVASHRAPEATTPRRPPPAPPSTVPTSLIAIEPAELAGRVWPLRGDLLIGRREGSDIRLDDSFVSTDHARLVFRHVSWMLEDVGSTNGTRLNDVTITGAAVVNVGDRVGVGTAVLEAR